MSGLSEKLLKKNIFSNCLVIEENIGKKDAQTYGWFWGRKTHFFHAMATERYRFNTISHFFAGMGNSLISH